MKNNSKSKPVEGGKKGQQAQNGAGKCKGAGGSQCGTIVCGQVRPF